MSINLAVSGATGQMGKILLELFGDDSRFEIVGALEASRNPAIGKKVSEIVPSLGSGATAFVHSSLITIEPKPRVLVDFTLPPATMSYLKDAQALGVGMVIGTTGFSDDQKKQIQKASRKIPIVLSPNMSVGMNLLFSLVEETAGRLGTDYDVEIAEAHHKHKKDAPSGSALRLGEAVAHAWGVNLKKVSTYGRQGITGERKKGTIGFHSIRGGDIIGDHTVFFAGPGENLELTHRAHTRQAFAQGALKAALFLSGKKNGFYDMQDVLGLR